MWGITSPGTLGLARARRHYASRQLKESPYIYQLRSYGTEIIQCQDSPKEAFFFFTRSAFLHRCWVQIATKGISNVQHTAALWFYSFFFLFIFLQNDVLLARPPLQSRETAANNGGKSNLIIGPCFAKGWKWWGLLIGVGFSKSGLPGKGCNMRAPSKPGGPEGEGVRYRLKSVSTSQVEMHMIEMSWEFLRERLILNRNIFCN